jgi:hypothetical protein
MNARAAEPASGAPDTPQVRLHLLGPQWMAMAEEAFAGVTQSPERYVAAGRWVAAWLDRLRALPPGRAAHLEPGSQDDVEERDAAAAAALLDAWDSRESADSGAPVPLTAGERAALTAAAFAIRYAEVADWLAARRRRRAMTAARSAAGASANGPRWLVLDEAGDPAGDPFITYRRLEVDPETGSGVLVETRPDDRFTGVIHQVRTALVDPNTGELIIDDKSRSWEFHSAGERESLVGRLRARDFRDGGEDASRH